MSRIIGFILVLLLVPAAGAAQVLTATLLGTGTPPPDIERFGAAVLVETPEGDKLLFDAGRGTMLRLKQLKVSSAQLDRVFITHLHFDHLVGLDDVWLVARLWQRKAPLMVLGPSGTEIFVENLKQAYIRDREVRSEQSGLSLETGDLRGMDIAESGVVYTRGDLKVTAFWVDHGHVKPALGYRVDYGPRSVVISGDTTYSENLIRHARGADVVIHEVAIASEKLLARNPRLGKVMASHTTPQQLGKVLGEIQPKLGLLTHILNYGVTEEHLMDAVRENYSGEVQLGEDLLAVDIGESVSVYRRR